MLARRSAFLNESDVRRAVAALRRVVAVRPRAVHPSQSVRSYALTSTSKILNTTYKLRQVNPTCNAPAIKVAGFDRQMLIVICCMRRQRRRHKRVCFRFVAWQSDSAQRLTLQNAKIIIVRRRIIWSWLLVLTVDRWAVTFGTAMRGPCGTAARPGLTSLYQM